MSLSAAIVLPADVEIVRVADLPEDVRSRLSCGPDARALTRPRSRTPSSVIDAATALLLEQFRQPTSIVDAVIRYSREALVDPRETLDQAFPLLRRFFESGILLPADSSLAAPICRTFGRGDEIHSYRVVEAVHTLVDTELYLVTQPNGRPAALKIARPGSEDRVRPLFINEAATLEVLAGQVTPQLIASGDWEERPFVVMSWHAGVDAHDAAGIERAAGAAGRSALLGIVERIAHAYTHVHERGVLQGDVHPRNVLVNAQGDVTLVDFALAVWTGDGSHAQTGAMRGVVDLFMDPELARARLQTQALPGASALSEQYSVAALLYSLITGGHTHDFSLEQEEMWRQLVTTPVLSFAAHGVHDLPATDLTLRRALSQEPADRYASTGEFAAALSRAVDADRCTAVQQTTPRPRPTSTQVLNEVLDRLSLDGELMRDGVDAPTASLNNGAAGFASALRQIACIREDERLLALADVWSNRALRDAASGRPDAFRNEELELTVGTYGHNSVYHTAAGVHAVAALVAHARGDDRGVNDAMGAFLTATDEDADHLDVAFGMAGTLIACSMLSDAIAPPKGSPIFARGDRVLARMWTAVGSTSPGSDDSPVRSLGAAHGWAGLLFAILQWHQTVGSSLPAAFQTRLDELAALATPVGRGASWPRRSEVLPSEDGLRASWCNGAAGFVPLWVLAHRCFGEERYRELAEAAAWTSLDGPQGGGDLCCGLAGRAFALLSYWRLCREARWLHYAHVLAERAAVRIRVHARRRNSLYNGDVGVALLAATLERPQLSCIPMFESEGWPRAQGE